MSGRNISARGGKTREKVEAFDLGRRAFQEQLPPGSNPFPGGSDEAKKWAEGYRAELEKALRG